jgi:cytochrome c biogenesis protein CcmG, thiol:disulfide interchange protein DsbE
MSAPFRPLPALALLALAIFSGIGCGGSEGGDYGGTHPNYAKALAGSPAPLAALHRQGDELRDGGTSAFERRIAALRGYPVVVNIWASWCVPCRQEFPVLQKLSARYGKGVAFLGVDSEDSSAAAATFLGEVPVPYPSYSDPNKDIWDAVGGIGGFPNTAFYNRSGEQVFIHPGPYRDDSEFEADVHRYALKSG